MPVNPDSHQIVDAARQKAIQAGAAFIEVVESIERDDYARAGVAQKELRRLGFVIAVHPLTPRSGRGDSHHDVARQKAIRAGAAFIEMVESTERDDYARAGVAQKELRRLGFVIAVDPRTPRSVRGGAR